jgi:ACR3 family arsenite transporter
MLRLLSILQKNLVWSIPAAMLVGLGFGYLFNAEPLKRLIVPVTFVMVYPMMVTLNVKSIFKGQDFKLQAVTQVINFLLIPLLAFYTGRLFFSGGEEKFGLWAVGLFLIGVLPTSGMTISWTGFAKGNKEAAIKMVIFGLVIGALAAPVYTKLFMGATVDVDMAHMFGQIVLFVFVPLAAGLLTQAWAKKQYGPKVWSERIQPKFPPFSAMGVILIAFLAMALKAKHIIANPGDILAILIPLAVFYLATYILLSVVGRLFFKRDDAVAMVFGVVMRDLSIALAIAMTAFGKQGLTIALLIALAYVVQIQSAAWYVRLVDTIFGKAAPIAAPQPLPAKALATAPVEPAPLAGLGLVPEFKRILYATDLSETARHAVRYACSLGDRYGAQVTVLHVIPDMLEEFSRGAGIDLADHMDRDAWERLNRGAIGKAQQAILQRIRETSAQVTRQMPKCPLAEENILVQVGHPARTIVATAHEGGYDLIVMGTHGHGKLGERLIGSIAEEVLRHSAIPVLVVRLPRESSLLVAAADGSAVKPAIVRQEV